MQNEINPYIAGSPVRTPSMFYGREQIFETVHRCLVESDPTQIVVLYGQRRMGKTSVLYQIPHRLPEWYIPLLIDLQGMSLDGLASLLWQMSQIIRRGLRRSAQIAILRADRDACFADPYAGIKAFFDDVQREVGERRIVLMFDETMLIADKIGSGELQEDVFACFSDLLSRYSFLDYVFSVGSKFMLMEDHLTGLSRPVVFKEIGFLEPDAARALIVEPARDVMAYEPGAVDEILTLTSGQPYYTQLICHELFSHVQAAGRHEIGVTDVEQILPGVVEMATAQLHYVWEETPELGKRVLSAWVEIEKQGERVVSPRQIGQLLVKRGIIAHDQEVENTVNDLRNRYIIKNKSYHFRVDLFRHWIMQNRHLDWL